MKLTIEQPAFAAALARVAYAVASKATLPITQYVLISASDGVTITATNLDAEVQAKAYATVETEGAVAVPFKMLSDVVKKMPKGALISIDSGKGVIDVKAGRVSVTIATLLAEDFPHMASDKYDFEMMLDPDQIANLFGKVSFAASVEETRYYLRGVYIHASDDGLTGVATDGHRLAKWACDVDATGMPSVIIPSETIPMIGSPEMPVKMQVSAGKVRFSDDTWSLVSKVVDGTFPDYTRIIPERKGTIARFAGKDMKASVDLVGAVLDKTNNAVAMDIGADGIGVFGRTGTNLIEDHIAAEIEGDPVRIGFNSKYVTSAMQHLEGNAVMYVVDAGSPARIEDDADAAFTLVIMPMRLQS